VEEPEEEEPEEEPLLKKANLNDVLSRLIPEFAILSGCETDLLFAIQTILAVPAQHDAVNEFLINLYSQVKSSSSASHSPLSILGTLVQRHYENLKDARDIFEVISSRMSTLDNPKELIAFLGQHLKPKELEKKQNGEVFTPPDLIQQKFDKLTLADPGIWSDPSKTFLDPANGIGNYPALAFHRLMDGLKNVIVDPADRKRHILENMLFMCELNAKNVEVSRKIFDPKGEFALKLYQGSYLDLDPKKEWGIESFDVIFGNPPYQPPSNGKKGGKSLWPSFVEKSFTHLKVNGFLVFVHPALWRKAENELHALMFGKQFHYLSIHTKQEGDKIFHATTRYDWYVLQNTPPTFQTPVEFDDGMRLPLMITPALPFLVNHGHDIMARILTHTNPAKINSLSTHEGATGNKNTSKTKTAQCCYPLVNSVSKTKGVNLMWSAKPLKHQYLKKVLFSNGEYIQPFYDSGKFGTTQGGIYIPVASDAEGIALTRFLKSKLVSYIVAATKWSNFETNKQIFWSIPHPHDLPENFTDTHVYAYFGLTPEEIGRIEAKQRGPGLTDYVAIEAPVVSVPLAPVTEPVVASNSSASNSSASNSSASPSTPDYSKLTVDDLKQLCRDRGIGGFSGKKKGDIIALLTK
jgi:hypothetical protein